MEGNERGGNIVIEAFVGDTRGNAGGESSDGSGFAGGLEGSTGAGTGTGTFGEIAIDPAQLASGGSSVSEPKRRGRKPGSTNKGKTEASANLAKAIGRGFLMFHTTMFAMTKVPEMQLSPEEATELGNAFDSLLACYDTGVSKKTAAWIEVGSALSGVYAGRFMHYYMRTAKFGSRQ